MTLPALTRHPLPHEEEEEEEEDVADSAVLWYFHAR